MHGFNIKMKTEKQTHKNQLKYKISLILYHYRLNRNKYSHDFSMLPDFQGSLDKFQDFQGLEP